MGTMTPGQKKFVGTAFLFIVVMLLGTTLYDAQEASRTQDGYTGYTPTAVTPITRDCNELYGDWVASWSTYHPDRPMTSADTDLEWANLTIQYGC